MRFPAMSDCITHSVDTTGMESCSARCSSASGIVGSATTTFMLLSKTLFRLPKSKEKKNKVNGEDNLKLLLLYFLYQKIRFTIFALN